MTNIVYIAASLDGFIADRAGKIDWLCTMPNPDKLDFGYAAFIERVDAIIMGRNTFETVCGFAGDWPYNKPVFVLSSSLKLIPEEYEGKVRLLNASPAEVVKLVNQEGYKDLYIDGGVTIQGFLSEDLIDEMIITQIPIVLGGGSPLFGELPEPMVFEHVKTEIFLNAIVQNHYRRQGR
jgi:dihydrofolate reductase